MDQLLYWVLEELVYLSFLILSTIYNFVQEIDLHSYSLEEITEKNI